MSLAKAKIKLWDWIIFYGIPIVLLLLYVLLGPYKAHGQTFQPNANAYPGDNGPYASGHLYLLPINPMPMVPSGTAFPNQGTGTTSYFYWVVSNDVDNAITSIPSGPYVTRIGPASLAANQSIQVQWQSFTLPLTYGTTATPPNFPITTSHVTYDVLVTSSDVPPSGACNCAIATGVTGSTAKDTGTRLPYTVTVPLWSEGYPTPGDALTFGFKGMIFDAGFPATPGIGTFTVATLPVGALINQLAIVSDGFGGIGAGGTGTDCTVGGGTTYALCSFDGAVWHQVGELVPRGPNNAIQFNSAGKQAGSANLLWNDATQTLTQQVAPTSGNQWVLNYNSNSTGFQVSKWLLQALDSTSATVQLFAIQGDYITNTHNSIKAQLDFFVASNTNNMAMQWAADTNTSGAFLKFLNGAGTLTLAAIGVNPAATSTACPMYLPTTPGLANQVLMNPGCSPGPNEQLFWGNGPAPVQLYSVTTQSADVPLTGSVAAVTITHAVTMPTNGCPCRVLANWAQYMVTTGSAVVAEEWVRDGSVNFAEAEWPIDVNNGPSGTGSGMSPNTYANSAVVTFTLNVEVDGSSVTAKAAPFHAFGLRNSRLELTVIPSN